MKMAIDKVVSETKRIGLRMPYSYQLALYNRPELIDQVANGVGSETNMVIYHLTPDTVWGLNINPTSHIHDWMYTFPLIFKTIGDALEHLRLADNWFYLNATAQFKDAGGWFEWLRMSRLNKYETGLNIGGSEAFWENKPRLYLPPEFEMYYRTKPKLDDAIVDKYTRIWNEVVDIEAKLISERIITTESQLKKLN